MKQALLALTLIALAPVSALADSSTKADQAASADKACAFHQTACAFVERRTRSFEW